MLRELRIRNLAIIDDATIPFDRGLNVLTGETGAGKSIIIDALCLALGERASGELIRSGEQEALIEAYFDFPPETSNGFSGGLLRELGIAVDDGIVMKRLLSAQGKSRAFINDSMVNLQTLRHISGDIIDVHGQYEHQSLLSSEKQLEMLDTYGGLLKERSDVAEAYETLVSTRKRVADHKARQQDRAQRIDMLRHQIQEIDSVGLTHGEDEKLSEELAVLENAGRLSELAYMAYEALYVSEHSCLTGLTKIIDSLKETARLDSRAEDALKNARDALPLLEETSYFLRDYKDTLNFSPDRLNGIQARLELIRNLQRKYGADIDAVLAFKERAVSQLEELEHSEEKMDELQRNLETHKNTLTERAEALSMKRKAVSGKIEKEVERTLSDLSMPDTGFSIPVLQEAGEDTMSGLKASVTGVDSVSYLISPNIGEESRPLSKIASGGELSRIMLALKGAMAKADKIPVLIFDEIDAGIGGKAAETVGRKLKALSLGHQTICITHLPQIASYGDVHLKIEKRVRGKRTVVGINRVDRDERAKEIARMLSGNGTAVSMKLAREMLDKKRTVKQKKG